MRFVVSVLTMLFVASASASESIYVGDVKATSLGKTKTAATAGIKPAPAG